MEGAAGRRDSEPTPASPGDAAAAAAAARGLPFATPPHAHEHAPFAAGPHLRDARDAPLIEEVYDSAMRRLPPKFGGAAGERSRAREAWSRMIEEEDGLNGRAAAGSDDEDAEVASLVGQHSGRGRAAVSELQLSSLSARFAELAQRPLPGQTLAAAAAARPPAAAAASDGAPPEAAPSADGAAQQAQRGWDPAGMRAVADAADGGAQAACAPMAGLAGVRPGGCGGGSTASGSGGACAPSEQPAASSPSSPSLSRASTVGSSSSNSSASGVPAAAHPPHARSPTDLPSGAAEERTGSACSSPRELSPALGSDTVH